MFLPLGSVNFTPVSWDHLLLYCDISGTHIGVADIHFWDVLLRSLVVDVDVSCLPRSLCEVTQVDVAARLA